MHCRIGAIDPVDHDFAENAKMAERGERDILQGELNQLALSSMAAVPFRRQQGQRDGVGFDPAAVAAENRATLSYPFSPPGKLADLIQPMPD